MLITRSPFRISFFGGGTDYPDWYNFNNGATLSTSINKYSYIILNKQEKINKNKFRIRYFYREEVNTLSQIKHPTIRNCLKFLKIKNLPYLDLIHFNDLPAQTGIGSSSAFTVGLLKILFDLKKITKSKKEIFKIATYIEQKLNKEAIGSQDQIISSVGGFLFTRYQNKKEPIFKSYNTNQKNIKKIQESTMLVYSNKKRTASNVASDVIKNINKKRGYFNEIYNLTLEAKRILENKKFSNSLFGELIDYSWQLKKKTSRNINTPEATQIIEFAKKYGAYGGKILGAGGGGMVMLYVEKKFQKQIINKLKNYKIINFKFENEGVKSLKVI